MQTVEHQIVDIMAQATKNNADITVSQFSGKLLICINDMVLTYSMTSPELNTGIEHSGDELKLYKKILKVLQGKGILSTSHQALH